MMTYFRKDLFSETSENDWTQKALKELRGKALEDIYVDIGLDEKVAPILLERNADSVQPISWSRAETGFKYLCEFILHEDEEAKINQAILEELNGGCEVIFLDMKGVSQVNIEALMKDVIPSYISLWVKGASQEVLLSLQDFNEKSAFSEMLILEESNFVTVDGDVESYLSSLKEAKNKWSGMTSPPLVLAYQAGHHFILNCVLLRVLKLLHYAIMENKAAETNKQPIIYSKVTSENENLSSLIELTSKANACVLGGSDVIFTDTRINDERIEVNEKNRRSASRNVVHLLAHESYLHQWEDIGSGSEMIEHLTALIFNEIWQ